MGNGDAINVWNDPWLSLSGQLRPMGPPSLQHLDTRVSALMVPETGDWDLAKVRSIVPDFEEHILSIKPSLAGVPDKLVWLGTK